jgi:hypothetical protein
MPKRSNPFQKAAFIIHQALEPEWTVTESDMLRDVSTGTLREVDITAKQLVAGHQIVLSIECRDHLRVADVSWVEQMYSKHLHLPTSKLALWSRSGFTREAIAKAKLHKIDTVSQEESSCPKWAHVANLLRDGYLKYVSPKLSPFIDVSLPTGTLERYEDVATWLFYDSEGKVVGSMAAFVEQILHNDFSRSTFLDHAPLGEGDFYVELVPPTDWFAEILGIGRCAINRIGAGVRTSGEESSISTMTVHQDERAVTLVTATLQHGSFELLVDEHEEEQPKAQAVVRRKNI